MTLKNIAETFRALCYGAATIFFVYASTVLHSAAAAAPAEVAQFNSSVRGITDFVDAQKIPVQHLFAQSTASFAIGNQMLANERDNQKAQLDFFNQFSTQAIAAVKSTNTSVTKLGEAADTLKTIAPALTTQINRIGDDFHVTLMASHDMITAMIADLSDPAIKTSLGNVAELTAALRDVAVKGNAIALDVKKVADHYEIKLDSPATTGQKFVVGAKVASVIIGNLFKGVL